MPPRTSSLRPRRRRSGGRRALWALLIALLAHLAAVGLLLALEFVHLKLPPDRLARTTPQSVSLRPLTQRQWAENRGSSRDERDSRPRPEPKKPERKREAQPKGQVVAVAPGNGQESPDAQYLAEKANKTAKETRAKNQTPFYRNAMPQRTSDRAQVKMGEDAAERAQIAGNNGRGADDRPLRQTEKQQQDRALEVPNVERRQQIAMREPNRPGPGASVHNQSERPEVRGNSNRLRITPGTSGGDEAEPSEGRQGLPGISHLLPSASAMDKIVGAAPNDHLADVEEGEGTFLNTKEWKYASFFNRVKQAVAMHWAPGEPLRQRDPTGNIYAGRDRYTILNVTLNEKGMVQEIHLDRSCGIDFLDETAIASFEKSQPFPNPPPGLVGDDRTVHFQFGFFLEMGGGPRLRLFRNN